MRTGHHLHIKALLQRLQPAQRHADTGISLAGSDRLEKLLRGPGEIDCFAGEAVLRQNAFVDGVAHGCRADSARVPGNPDGLRSSLSTGQPESTRNERSGSKRSRGSSKQLTARKRGKRSGHGKLLSVGSCDGQRAGTAAKAAVGASSPGTVTKPPGFSVMTSVSKYSISGSAP